MDQLISSATNVLAVVLLAGQLSPVEFGAAATASVVIALMLVVVRSFLCEPFLLRAAGPWRDPSRDHFGPVAVWVVTAAGFGAVCVTWVLTGSGGLAAATGSAAFAAALQDALRYRALGAHRITAVLAADSIWLLAIFPGMMLLEVRSATAAALWWIVAASLGMTPLLRIRPPLFAAPAWHRVAPTLPTGVHTFLDRGINVALPLVGVALLGVIASGTAVGAVRSVTLLFSVVNVIAQAVFLGTAMNSGQEVRSEWKRALAVSALMVSVVVAAAASIAVAPGFATEAAFGENWIEIRRLLLPCALAQIFAAAAMGPVYVMRWRGRLRVLTFLRIASLPIALSLPLLGALLGGSSGFLYGTATANGAYALAATIALGQLSSSDESRRSREQVQQLRQ